MFEPGQKVRHRASGEVGIVIAKSNSPVGDAEPDQWKVSTGFDKTCIVPESLLEPIDDPPPSPISEPGKMLRVVIAGMEYEVRALRKQGLGMVCQSKTGVHFVRAEHAADPAEFQRVLDSL